MSKYKVLKDNLKSLVGEEFEKTLPIIAGDYEDKIKRQAAEITRLLEENKELKEKSKKWLETSLSRMTEITRLLAENEYLKKIKTKDIEHWCDVCTKQSVIEEARAGGQNEAWELMRKLRNMNFLEAVDIFDSDNPWEIIMSLTYHEVAAKVSQWEKAKEKPQKTIMQDFFEKFPNTSIYKDTGLPMLCPFRLGYCKEPTEDECGVTKCVDCWNRPLEQIGEE